MSKRTESSNQEQHHHHESSQSSTPPPTPIPIPTPPPPPPPSPGSPVRQPTAEELAEQERQDNLRQFNILLTPAFAAFSQIVDSLFLTGVGGMSIDNFRKNKITHIINCTHEAPNWRLSGVECHRIPIDDSPIEDLSSHLDRSADKIQSILTNGGKVVVHCVAGVSRSAAIVISYLIKYKKMSLHDAYNHVQSCRRVVRPNNGFFSQLIAFESKILGCTSVKMVKLKRDDVMIEVPDFFETEHRRFVLMETFKAKAHILRPSIDKPGPSPVVQGQHPVSAGGNVPVKSLKKQSVTHPQPHSHSPIHLHTSPGHQLVHPTVKPLGQPLGQPQGQPLVQPLAQPLAQSSTHSSNSSNQSSSQSPPRSISRSPFRSPIRIPSRTSSKSSKSRVRTPSCSHARTLSCSPTRPPTRSPSKTPHHHPQSQSPSRQESEIHSESQSQIQTRPQSQPPSQH